MQNWQKANNHDGGLTYGNCVVQETNIIGLCVEPRGFWVMG